ncbi:hypothetical protein BDD12DRAFT_894280 [Trichophaea hybrida]|nr:hypothetical protein BDD12DRAFT_894280 [Trichophaea hybrida]
MTGPQFCPPEQHASEYKLLYDMYNRTVTELATTKHQLSIKESELHDAHSENLELYKRMRTVQEEGQHAKEQLQKLKSIFDDDVRGMGQTQYSTKLWILYDPLVVNDTNIAPVVTKANTPHQTVRIKLEYGSDEDGNFSAGNRKMSSIAAATQRSTCYSDRVLWAQGGEYRFWGSEPLDVHNCHRKTARQSDRVPWTFDRGSQFKSWNPRDVLNRQSNTDL